ncbi:MAG: beta-hexosaminidase [Ruminococcus sp.]|nr:beta-hexosaminidase [Ruminococcus sp.]
MQKGKFLLIAFISVALIMALSFSVVYFLGDSKSTLYTEETSSAKQEEDMIKDMIEDMTVEEKISQMIMLTCHDEVNIEEILPNSVGGICLFGHSFEGKTEAQVIDMISLYNSLSKTPMIVSVDEEGGSVNRVSTNENLRAAPFWSPSQLYSQGGFELIKSDTEEKCDLLKKLGINVNLAPVCDVPLSEDNYIYDRCFSLDYDETSQYVENVVKIMKEKQVGSTLKHFPGYGGSVDTHESVSYDQRKYEDFENGDFKPFISGINEGADCVMVSHNIVTCMDDENPASLSKPVHDILRDTLKFDGVILTDDLKMGAVTKFTDKADSYKLALKAGNDMISCEDYYGAKEAMLSCVESKEVVIKQIDESVYRILKLKMDLGIIK